MKVELPHVGESVTEGIIGKWLKKVGDRVEKYDSLVEVVTDKVNMEMPSPVSGVLTGILAKEGETVPMGSVIAEIHVEGEEADADAPDSEAPTPASTRQPDTIDRTGVLLKDTAPVGPTGSGGPISSAQVETTSRDRRKRYSPAVQRLAEESGVDLSRITGTGMGGRVTRKDVQRFIETSEAGTAPSAPVRPKPSADEERLPLSPIRRIIAENMVKSATQIPQAWTLVEVDVTGLVRLRESTKENFRAREGVNLTYLPFIANAVAQTLRENPLLNSSWGGDAIIVKRRINIGIAVAAPDGLVVPVVRDADTLSVTGLALVIDDLTNRSRQGKLKLEDVQGGTFTVNNTGALGSVVSQALVNYQQAAIITTEAIVKRPVVMDDAIAIRSMMNLSLTFDHRILDGGEAGAFLNGVKLRLEAIGPETGVL